MNSSYVNVPTFFEIRAWLFDSFVWRKHILWFNITPSSNRLQGKIIIAYPWQQGPLALLH